MNKTLKERVKNVAVGAGVAGTCMFLAGIQWGASTEREHGTAREYRQRQLPIRQSEVTNYANQFHQGINSTEFNPTNAYIVCNDGAVLQQANGPYQMEFIPMTLDRPYFDKGKPEE